MKAFLFKWWKKVWHVINEKGPSTEEGILGAGRWCFQIQKEKLL
jgi:hypothetical protein